MISLVAACSHNSAMYRPSAEWPKVLAWALGGWTGHPSSDEAPEAIAAHETRISNSFAALRQRFDAADPRALVVVCTDSGRLFSNVQVPQFCTFLGEDLWGSTAMSELGEPAEGHVVHLCGAPELAEFVQQELVDVGFDMNYARELRPMGQPYYGAPAALVEPVIRLGLQAVPVVPIFVNVHRRPAPNGRRCYELGAALSSILKEWPEPVAVLASGGLSHDYLNDRAGWVDEPFDRWVLDMVRRGKGIRLGAIYDLDSDSIRGGAAEVRLWAAAAGAGESLGAKAHVVDYLPCHAVGVGLGFAYWEAGHQGA